MNGNKAVSFAKFAVGILLIIIGIVSLQQYFPQYVPSSVNDAIASIKNNFKLPSLPPQIEREQVVYQESVVTDVVEKSLPSVVTISIKTTRKQNTFGLNPFNPFSPFQQLPGEEREIQRNIGSGFIITKDGLIITNKHVVLDTDAQYSVITNDQEEYVVNQIYRDPLNDLAILKIDANNVTPLKLGDSSKLKLGQLAIAIGTPLGEFQNTVTVGIISGIGRGITAGSPFEGFVEKLDNVIQTDAAISAGNSGGPLLNSKGEAVGVNTAVAAEGQNIGFAIPINVVSTLIEDFHRRGGTFERPYIGVRYQMVDQRTAILNDVVAGAYVESVVEGSPAAEAGIQQDDIITRIDGKRIDGSDDESLAKIILDKKIGDTVAVEVWRNGETETYQMKLEAYNE
ncbi:MAG TPA: trypsin-like peptidase domain-containing protein [Candidatus Woesebacteria bacterium]|nr:trypsin-like peptidase domain-containing protein [Candidatus Woesebacteria bacterium]